MKLTDQPIPPRPEVFSPMGAPPGVAINYNAFKWIDGTPWWINRPLIVPITQVTHTNAASGEGSLQSQINWGNASARGNTHPHYAVNRPQPTKLVPTDRRAIANSSMYDVERAAGVQDCSWWTIAIETADAGFIGNTPVDGVGDFIFDHAEIVARINAYESIVWNIPLEYPTFWTDPGSITHTEPFPYPYFTIKPGKICPGPAKKKTFREQILPRARQIRASWLGEEEMYIPLETPWRFDSRLFSGKVPAGEVIPFHPGGIAQGAKAAHVNFTFIQADGTGFITAWGDGPRPTTSVLNPNSVVPSAANAVNVSLKAAGGFNIYSSVRTHLLIDVLGYYT